MVYELDKPKKNKKYLPGEEDLLLDLRSEISPTMAVLLLCNLYLLLQRRKREKMMKKKGKEKLYWNREWFREHIEGRIAEMHLDLRTFTSNATAGLFPAYIVRIYDDRGDYRHWH